MRWLDIDHRHHGRRATVIIERLDPFMPWVRDEVTGYVVCKEPGQIPLLEAGDELHSFLHGEVVLQ